MNIRKTSKRDQGSVMLITALFFTLLGTAAILGTSNTAVHSLRDTQNTTRTRQSYAATESSLEDVLYRLKEGMDYSSTETLSVGGSSATTEITSLLGGSYQIATLGEFLNNGRSARAIVEASTGVAFNYGLQVGRGGITLTGSSGINGSVYSNGNITGSGSNFITGSAIAANSESLNANQSNGVAGTPTNTIIFGNNNATQDISQSFTVSSDSPINKIRFYIKKNGNPSNATVRIALDNSGSPSATYVASGTLTASLVSTSYGWIDITLTTNPALDIGTTYWVVVDAATSASNYYTVAANSNGYTNGQAKIGRYGTSWSNTTPSGLDTYFEIYLGGLTSSITGISQWNQLRVGTSGNGIAHAQTIDSVTATGTIYCQTGANNNKACDTSLPAPVSQPWPISDSNIDAWKTEAQAGGTTTGNINAGNGWQTVALGPQKIVGNLSVGGSATLNVAGTLWVTGNLTIDGAGRMQLASSYGANSGTIIVDGNIIIGGSSPVSGSGTNGSYILIVSLSDCPTSSSCGSTNAIDISGAAGAVVLIAQNGTINFSGSASAKQATGYKINLSGATTVTYESGLANLNFSSGPSGSWDISSWRESE